MTDLAETDLAEAGPAAPSVSAAEPTPSTSSDGAEAGAGAGAPAGRGRVPAWLPGVVVLVGTSAVRIGDRELWLDEAFSLAASHHLVATVARTHGTMSLYYALLAPWASLSPSAAWVRALSLVCMAGALAVFAALVARQHGHRAGCWAGLAAACSYLPARYAIEARSYAVVALLSTTAWYALDHVLADADGPAGGTGRRWRRLHVACLVLLPLAHGLAALQVAVQLVAVVLARPGRRVLRHQLIATAASGVVVVGLLTFGIEEVGNWLDPLSRRNLDIFAQEVLHPLPAIALLLAVVAGATAVVLARSLRGEGDPLVRFRAVALTCWGPGAVAVLLAISVVRPSQLGRYSLSAAFGIAGLLAVGVDRLLRRRLPGPTGIAAAVVLLGLLATSHLAIGGDPSPFRATVARVDAGARPGDRILFRSPGTRLAFEAAWMDDPGAPELAILGPGAPLGELDRFARVPSPAELAADVPSGGRVWFVDLEQAHAPGQRPSVLADEAFRARFTEQGTWSSGDVDLHLLVAR